LAIEFGAQTVIEIGRQVLGYPTNLVTTNAEAITIAKALDERKIK